MLEIIQIAHRASYVLRIPVRDIKLIFYKQKDGELTLENPITGYAILNEIKIDMFSYGLRLSELTVSKQTLDRWADDGGNVR